MAYQALYRKWRPQTFDDMVGQSAVTHTLKNAISNHKTSHAYLFTGPRGTGKRVPRRCLQRPLTVQIKQTASHVTNVISVKGSRTERLAMSSKSMLPATMVSKKSVIFVTRRVMHQRKPNTKFILSTKCICFNRSLQRTVKNLRRTASKGHLHSRNNGTA